MKGGTQMSKQFSKGEIIFREGDNGDSFYEVIMGTVGIYTNYGGANQQKLTDVGKGHIFGEMALFDAFPRSATAVAEDEVSLTEITISDVRGYFESNPDKVKAILLELTERLDRLTDDYNEATQATKGLYPENEDRKPGILDQIKKFVEFYDVFGKIETPSAEYLRELEEAEHQEGFAKKVEKYEKGTIIFREGDMGKCMYDIHYGSIGIYTDYGKSNEKCLTTLGPNKFFGELGMLNNKLRTATAVVLEDDTTLESIYMDDFEELFQKNPVKIEMLIKHLSNRIRGLTTQYTDACKLLYDVNQAELKNSVSEELRKKTQEVETNIYS